VSDERTEHPTARRLLEARRKGQIARTREAGQAASLIAVTMAIGWMGPAWMHRLGQSMTAGLERMGASAMQPLTEGDVTQMAIGSVGLIGLSAAPVAFLAVITVVALNVAQGGWNVASEALKFDVSRLNPSSGFKKLGFSQGGFELLRTTVSVAVIAVLGWLAIAAYLPGSRELSRLTAVDAAATMWEATARLLTRSALALLALSAADYFMQRHRLMQSLKMTKQEVKEDHKLSQGNPQIKARVRRIQREMVRRRMLTATKTATVVITNPTHYAVALEYRRAAMSAPIVVAKGQGTVAQRIKAIAREHNVPMVENVQLARALYAEAEVGDVIPGPLFEAVAEVLAYLIRLKQLVL
jgi:flagellar biosynthetic protein FlhB